MFRAGHPQILCGLAAFAACLPVILLVAALFYRVLEIPTGKFTGRFRDYLFGTGKN